jgi:hypothetical protein
LAPIAPMLREAQRRFGGAPIGRVWIVSPGDSGAVVTVFPSDRARFAYADAQVAFDGATGKVLGNWSEQRPAMRTYGVLYGLHLAHFAPALLRWLYFLGGAMLTLAVASGMVLWIVKRRERAPLGPGNRVVERLNAGVLAGVPLAFAAYLLANRLLPLGLPGRAEAEVSAALWTAAAALLAGAVLRPALAWPILLGLLAAICLLLPWLAGPASFAQALTSDAALAAGNLLLLVTGLALALLVRAQVRRLRNPPQPRGRRAAA